MNTASEVSSQNSKLTSEDTYLRMQSEVDALSGLSADDPQTLVNTGLEVRSQRSDVKAQNSYQRSLTCRVRLMYCPG